MGRTFAETNLALERSRADSSDARSPPAHAPPASRFHATARPFAAAAEMVSAVRETTRRNLRAVEPMSDRQETIDVLVIGGGTAGFGAAVAAGRQGLDVTLLEATSKIGGVMAFCPGMPWGGGYPVDSSRTGRSG